MNFRHNPPQYFKIMEESADIVAAYLEEKGITDISRPNQRQIVVSSPYPPTMSWVPKEPRHTLVLIRCTGTRVALHISGQNKIYDLHDPKSLQQILSVIKSAKKNLNRYP